MPDLTRDFEHVVIADPAPHPGLAELAITGDGYLHVLAAKRELSLEPSRPRFRTARRSRTSTARSATPSEPLESGALRTALCGPSGAGRSPEACGLALRVLAEIGVVRVAPSGPAVRAEAVSSVRGDLSSSMSFRLIEKANEECVRYLSQPKPSSSPLEAAA